jgi:hypothetical protein
MPGEVVARNLIVESLSEHARKARDWVGGSISSPGDPPVLSASNGGPKMEVTGVVENCEMCSRPLHPGLIGGQPVSPEEWYGLDEDVELNAAKLKIEKEIDNSIGEMPEEYLASLEENGIDPRDVVPVPLRRRKEEVLKLLSDCEMRRQAVDALERFKCASLLAEGGELYKVITPAQAKLLEEEWDFARAVIQDRLGIPATERLRHRVPLAAGGCPIHPKNIVPDSSLSERCIEADEKLFTAQRNAAERWSNGGF